MCLSVWLAMIVAQQIVTNLVTALLSDSISTLSVGLHYEVRDSEGEIESRE